MRSDRHETRRGAAGLATMILGAAMLFPSAAYAAQPVDGEHKVTVCHRTNAVTNPYRVITVDSSAVDGSLGNGNNDHTHHDGPPFDFAADPDVAYPTPRAGDQWGDIIPPYDFDGGSFPGKNWTEVGQAIHANECGSPPLEVSTTLTVTKVVDGDAAPATWTFPFTGLSGGFDLTDEAPSTGPLAVDPGAPYVITETDAGDADATSVSCTGAVAVVDGSSVTVEVAEGGDGVCTFTNTFEAPPPETGSLTVIKEVTGLDAPDTWSFGFDGGTLGTFSLADDDDRTVFDGLAAGLYVITEPDAGEADLVDIDCGDAVATVDIAEDFADGSVSVDLAEGADVVCTFTNDYAEVLDDVVVKSTTTTTTTTTSPAKTTDVLGETVTRTLPRTGGMSGWLAALGLALVAAGAGMVRSSRRLQSAG